MQCISCESTNVVKKGLVELSNGDVKQRYSCKDCKKHFSVIVEDDAEDDNGILDTSLFKYERSDDWLAKNVYSSKRLVITSAQNNTEVDVDFLKSLLTYCNYNDANLVIIPIKHRTITSSEDDSVYEYDERIDEFLCENTIEFSDNNLRIYAGLKIQATAENPLSGLEPLSKGWSIIVGHAQFQLKTLPNSDGRVADILTTTGAVTVKNYSKTKLGEKAKFNHSMSAMVVELAEDTFHIRNLNWDEKSRSFCDINKCYSRADVSDTFVEAIVTGDEHVVFRDPNVSAVTYTNLDSLVNITKPRYIVRHDVLDAYSISHHHNKNVFTKFAKFVDKRCSIKDELTETIDYIISTTPYYAKSIIVQSNHNEHLTKWLNEVDIKTEPWNAIIYHDLMHRMLLDTKMGPNGASYPDPFKLFTENIPGAKDLIAFIPRSGMKILGIEVGQHGDRGISGARGSAKSFAKFPVKTVVGHSHSPAVQQSCYVVGTSSKLQLEYNVGASSWHHAHVIIHYSGKRQIVFINKHGFTTLKQ